MSKITPCLWFDGKAEEAAQFHVSLLPDSRIGAVVPYGVETLGGKSGDSIRWSSPSTGHPTWL
jgi:predicted 3-demethylubiquinone-9 3-methyltransferase (glyoxalase superfamily)